MQAIFSRMLSIWNENKRRFIVSKDQVILNVWTRRSSTDFLHYLKFEFVQYTFHGGFLFVCLCVMPFIVQPGAYEIDHINWAEVDNLFNRVNILYGLADLLSLILLRILTS